MTGNRTGERTSSHRWQLHPWLSPSWLSWPLLSAPSSPVTRFVPSVPRNRSKQMNDLPTFIFLMLFNFLCMYVLNLLNAVLMQCMNSVDQHDGGFQCLIDVIVRAKEWMWSVTEIVVLWRRALWLWSYPWMINLKKFEAVITIPSFGTIMGWLAHCIWWLWLRRSM